VNRFVFLLALALPGCTVDGLDEIFCDPDEPCWTASSTSGEVCPTGPLGYDPARTDAEPIAFASDVSGVAVRLSPFSGTTQCSTIVVGFATAGGCAIPSKEISLIAFDSENPVPVDLPTGGTIDHLIPTGTTTEPIAGITEMRFHVATTHKAGAYPIIGIVSRPGMCSVGFDSTCQSNAVEMNYKGKWSELDGTSLYFGLADCAP